MRVFPLSLSTSHLKLGWMLSDSFQVTISARFTKFGCSRWLNCKRGNNAVCYVTNHLSVFNLFYILSPDQRSNLHTPADMYWKKCRAFINIFQPNHVATAGSRNLFFLTKQVHLSNTRCVPFGLYSRWTCGIVRGPCVVWEGRRTDTQQMDPTSAHRQGDWWGK